MLFVDDSRNRGVMKKFRHFLPLTLQIQLTNRARTISAFLLHRALRYEAQISYEASTAQNFTQPINHPLKDKNIWHAVIEKIWRGFFETTARVSRVNWEKILLFFELNNLPTLHLLREFWTIRDKCSLLHGIIFWKKEDAPRRCLDWLMGNLSVCL